MLAGVCAALGMTIVDLLDETGAEFRAAEPVVVDLATRMDERADVRAGGVRLAA